MGRTFVREGAVGGGDSARWRCSGGKHERQREDFAREM
jgi:hypothetical protein